MNKNIIKIINRICIALAVLFFIGFIAITINGMIDWGAIDAISGVFAQNAVGIMFLAFLIGALSTIDK